MKPPDSTLQLSHPSPAIRGRSVADPSRRDFIMVFGLILPIVTAVGILAAWLICRYVH